MKNFIYLFLISLLIFSGCSKKPEPAPEPEIPQAELNTDENSNGEEEQVDLTDLVIPVVDSDGSEAVLVNGEEVVQDIDTENGEGADSAATAIVVEDTTVAVVETEPEEEPEPEVETQVVVDPILDQDEIIPDSTWIEYMIKPKETLSIIALNEYGNPNEWRRIYGWNREKIGDDPNLIHPYHYLDLLKPRENAVEWEYDYYIHKVTKGETLWTISRKEYGDEYAWVVLYWDNESILEENEGILTPGMELKVRTELWPEF